MRTVILCRDLKSLMSHIRLPPEHVQLLVLHESPESCLIRAFCERRGLSEELPRAELFRSRSGRFRSEYVSAIGRLNIEFGSREWWAMPLSTKNPISSELCLDIFSLVLIVDLIRNLNGCLVVVTDRDVLGMEVAAWGRTEGVAIVNAVRPAWTWSHIHTRLSFLPILYLAARSVWFKLRTGRRNIGSPAGGAASMVMITLVHPHSITSEGRFRDTYFGELEEWLGRETPPVVVAGVIQGQSLPLVQAFQENQNAVRRISIDAGLELHDIFRNTWEALRGFLACRFLKVSSEIGGVSIGNLVRHAVKDAHASGEVFRSLYIYRCARRLASEAPTARYLYPYENRAWEKMLLLGVRSVSRRARMIGYQHASITASHTNFVFAENEAEITPLPDVIVAFGEVTRDRLIQDGHPQALLRVGCALRQPKTGALAIRSSREEARPRILVALGARVTEYLRVLCFLNDAIGAGHDWEIRIRPHPTLPLEKAIRLLPEGQTRFSYSLSKGAVGRDLEWAGVVLYASSTLGMEAVGAGIPAVYLDLGEILPTDPMEGWTAFKWIARQPSELAPVLSEIGELSDALYEQKQRQGRSYVDAYMAPVNEKSLRVFIEA